MITAYKCTRADATDFKTGTIKYTPGIFVELADVDPAHVGPCGKGLHVSPTARMTCQFGDRYKGPWRWFEVEINETDVLAKDECKFRVRRMFVKRELSFADVFGKDLKLSIESLKAEIATWKQIPWLKPERLIVEADLEPLLNRWHKAVSQWNNRFSFPKKARIVRTYKEAAAAADDAAAAAADAAAAAAAAARTRDRVLAQYAEWVVDILIDLQAPGCEFLDLVPVVQPETELRILYGKTPLPAALPPVERQE